MRSAIALLLIGTLSWASGCRSAQYRGESDHYSCAESYCGVCEPSRSGSEIDWSEVGQVVGEALILALYVAGEIFVHCCKCLCH